jgi:hypothetical protein
MFVCPPLIVLDWLMMFDLEIFPEDAMSSCKAVFVSTTVTEKLIQASPVVALFGNPG